MFKLSLWCTLTCSSSVAAYSTRILWWWLSLNLFYRNKSFWCFFHQRFTFRILLIFFMLLFRKLSLSLSAESGEIWCAIYLSLRIRASTTMWRIWRELSQDIRRFCRCRRCLIENSWDLISPRVMMINEEATQNQYCRNLHKSNDESKRAHENRLGRTLGRNPSKIV